MCWLDTSGSTVDNSFMPYRKTLLISGEVYHIFNRGIAKQPIFLSSSDYKRCIEVINFYRFREPKIRFSHYNRLPQEQKRKFFENLLKKEVDIEIFSYCLMPNHFHLLLKPLNDNSLSKFMGNFQNSYSKYFNAKYDRVGALFQATFKAIRMESNEQLIHVSRYIHLNPSSSLIIKIENLFDYPWSSLKDYFQKDIENRITSTDYVLDYFGSKDKYKRFILDQADYQRKLQRIKHLMLE